MRRKALHRLGNGKAELGNTSAATSGEQKGYFARLSKPKKIMGFSLVVVIVGGIGYWFKGQKSKFETFSAKAKLLLGKAFFNIDEEGIHLSAYPIIDNTGSNFQIAIQRPKVWLRINGEEFSTEDRTDSVLIAKRSQSELGAFHINVGWKKLGKTVKQVLIKVLPNIFSIISMVGSYSAKFKELKTSLSEIKKDSDLNFLQIHQRISEIKIESSKLVQPGPNGIPIISDTEKIGKLKAEKDMLEKKLALGQEKMKLMNELAVESTEMLKKMGITVEYAVTFSVKGIQMPKKYTKLSVL